MKRNSSWWAWIKDWRASLLSQCLSVMLTERRIWSECRLLCSAFQRLDVIWSRLWFRPRGLPTYGLTGYRPSSTLWELYWAVKELCMFYLVNAKASIWPMQTNFAVVHVKGPCLRKDSRVRRQEACICQLVQRNEKANERSDSSFGGREWR